MNQPTPPLYSGPNPTDSTETNASGMDKFTLKCKDYINDPEEKKFYNELLFSEVAPKYDFVTKALSLGRDGAWKKHLVNVLPAELAAPECVDLACGTGDVSRLLSARYPQGHVVGIDLTAPMLELARTGDIPENLSYLQRDMNQTGLASNSVDIVTGSYALRNAPDLELALEETRRILKPGGYAAFLDFSKPSTRAFQIAEYWLLKSWGSWWGYVLHRNCEIYAYISNSLATFPDRTQLRKRFSDSGFTVTHSRRFYFGIMEMFVLTTDQHST
jgi:ubiquinone/menaquinone biosynthesis methyltransferase